MGDVAPGPTVLRDPQFMRTEKDCLHVTYELYA